MPHAPSPLHLPKRLEVVVVEFDEQRPVLSMNAFARRVLPVQERLPFDRMGQSFHPDRLRPKVERLLDQAEATTGFPVANPPPAVEDAHRGWADHRLRRHRRCAVS